MNRETRNDRLFLGFLYGWVGLLTLAVLYPLVFIVSSSFSSSGAIMSGKVWLWPVEPTLEGYRLILQNDLIITGFTNSLFYTTVGTLINVFLTVCAGFALSKPNLIGRNVVMFLFTFTMIFYGGLIPTYLLVKDLGMIDTRWALLIPNALAVWNLIIARTFFQSTISKELGEAAEIDGAGHLQFFVKIVLPVSKPIIAVLFLFYAVGHWNAYFDALIYLKSQDLYSLQLVLRQILIQNQISASLFSDSANFIKLRNNIEIMKYSTIVIAAIPALIIYPFVQKHFVKGVMIGSIKG